MIRTSIATNFWRYGRGLLVANVEAVGTKGLVFTHRFARIRITSSNVAHGQLNIASTELLDQRQRDILSDAVAAKRSVQLHFEEHVLSAPWRGEVCDEMFITKVVD
jgi:hypothetical protein